MALKPEEFCARVDSGLLRSKPLNAGRSRLGGEPFLVQTRMYDRSTDQERLKLETEAKLMQQADEKAKKKAEEQAGRAARDESKAGQAAEAAAAQAAADAQRTNEHAAKLAEEHKKQEAARAERERPKPGTQCIMRGVPKVTKMRDLRRMFESFGPVKRVKVIKLASGRSEGEEDGEPDYGDVDASLVDPALRQELMTVAVVFGEHWVARKALKNLYPNLQWSSKEKAKDIGDTEMGGGGRRRRRPAASGRRSVPLRLPSVLASANQSIVVNAQRERALNHRATTPTMNHNQLLTQSLNEMGINKPGQSPDEYVSWREWTSGHGSGVKARHELRQRGKKLVAGQAHQALSQPGSESIAVLRQAWHAVDEDLSGSLDRHEVGTLIEQLLGHPLSAHMAKLALQEMDEDNSGFVSFAEFEEWWRASAGGTHSAGGQAGMHAYHLAHLTGGEAAHGTEPPPKTPGPIKRRNALLSASMALDPRHEISFESAASSALGLHGKAGGKTNAFTGSAVARARYFDDTCGWRTKTQHIRASRQPKAIPKHLIYQTGMHSQKIQLRS